MRASGVVAGGRHVSTRLMWQVTESQNRNKMAATGDDAAAMDSISRAPAVHSAALNPVASASNQEEGPEAVAESPAVIPKKPNTNSE